MPIADLAGNVAADFTNEPAINATGPQGLCVALNANTLDVSPPWVRVDRYEGVRIQRVSIRRGRSSERDTIPIGEATITGVDLDGVLDPTNPYGPFYGISDTKFDPVKPAAYGLQNPVTGEWFTIFRGFIDSLEYDLDLSGKFATFTIRLVDPLDLLSRTEVVPGKAGDSGSATGDAVYFATDVQSRIYAALADAALSAGVTEWPADLMDIFSGNIDVQQTVYSPRTPILTVCTDAADAEFPGVSNFFASREGVITFRGRYSRFNVEDASYKISKFKVGDWPAVHADEDTALISGLTMARSKDSIVNAALVTPHGIADADIAGQFVSDGTSVEKRGALSISYENLITLQGHEGSPLSANDETKTFGRYYIETQSEPRTRVSKVVFRPQDPDSLQGPATWNVLSKVEISDLFRLKTSHSWGGGIDDDYFVEGLTYEIVPGNQDFPEVTLTAELSPRQWFPDGYVFTA